MQLVVTVATDLITVTPVMFLSFSVELSRKLDSFTWQKVI